MAQTAWRADVDRHESTKLEIGLLGPLVVARDGRDLEVAGPKRRALLILLALNVGQPMGRDHFIESLWPRHHTGREESRLRTHVSYLRDGIEPDRDHESTAQCAAATRASPARRATRAGSSWVTASCSAPCTT